MPIVCCKMIGAEIRLARRAKGWTQAELAAELGVVVGTVYRWEADRVTPPRRSEIALRQVLGQGQEESKPAKSKRRKS